MTSSPPFFYIVIPIIVKGPGNEKAIPRTGLIVLFHGGIVESMLANPPENGYTFQYLRDELIGTCIPPVTKDPIYGAVRELNCDGCTILDKIKDKMPVIFIGPYEHHTNELMWREAFAEVRVVPLDAHGIIDMNALRKMISDPAYAGRVNRP